MTGRTKKRPKSKGQRARRQPAKGRSARDAKVTKVLEALDGGDALSILKVLVERQPKLAEEVDAIAAEMLGEVDVEDYAAGVQSALECLAVEEVWDRSGRTRDGYVDPGEAAWAMFEEALKPFRQEVEKYGKLSLVKEVNLCYQGILKGIYDFEQESATEFKQWAVDAPTESFGEILREWKTLRRSRMALAQMRAFVVERCPEYAEWATRRLRR